MKKIENPCEICGNRMSCRRECFARRDFIRALHKALKLEHQEERKKEREERERENGEIR